MQNAMIHADSHHPLAVVTGASKGIGLELTRQFVDHDFDVVMVAESEELEVAADTIAPYGRMVEPVRADLATRDGVDTVYRRLKQLNRPVSALALNAGVGVGGAFIDNTFEDELNVINVNIIGTVYLAKLVVRDMVRRGEGRVLFTASIAAEMPAPFQAVYAASKAFVLSFSQALRNELKETGVTVTALQPGATDTAFFERAGMQDTRIAQSRKDDPADVARAGFAALMKGKDHVVASSLRSKLQSGLATITPDTILADVHRKLSEPGSGRDQEPDDSQR